MARFEAADGVRLAAASRVRSDKVTKEKRALDLIEEQCAGTSYRPKPEDFTCWTCSQESVCPARWDLHNTGGDCLVEFRGES